MNPPDQESVLEFDTQTGFNIRVVRREPPLQPAHHPFPQPAHLAHPSSILNQLDNLCVQQNEPLYGPSGTAYVQSPRDSGEILGFPPPLRFPETAHAPNAFDLQVSVPHSNTIFVHPDMLVDPTFTPNSQSEIHLMQPLGAFQTAVPYQQTFQFVPFQESSPSHASSTLRHTTSTPSLPQILYHEPEPISLPQPSSISPRIQSAKVKNGPTSSSSTSASPLSDAPTGSRPSSPGHYKSKARHRFNAGQTRVLKTRFAATPLPTPAQIAAVAREVESEYGKVKVWFQNRRAVLKRRSSRADNTGDRRESDGGDSSSGSEYKE